MSLFKLGEFKSHSGLTLPFKIECDALTDADFDALASIVASSTQFGGVIGIPRGGLRFAKALKPHITTGPLLIVDDVLTTGKSMEEALLKSGRGDTAIGVVIFARKPAAPWIKPVFSLSL